MSYRRVALLACALALVPASGFAATPAPAAPATVRNDYADPRFSAALSGALRAFYTRDFAAARKGFEDALAIRPDNTLAISFLNATLAQTPGAIDRLVDDEEAVVTKDPKDYLGHVRLGFSYLFASLVGRDRKTDAREEFNAAVQLQPKNPAAHDGLGYVRYVDQSLNRAKTEFLAALEADRNDVLAREHLALIYQVDLRDPQRGLAYIVDVPNLVPTYPDIYFHLASLMHDLGQYDAAVKYATRGLEEDTGHVGEAGKYGYTLLARIYIDEKRLGDARRVLNASVTAGQDVTYAHTLLRKIDNGDYGKTPSASPSPSAAPKKKP